MVTESRRRKETELGARFRRRVFVNEQGRRRQRLPFSVDGKARIKGHLRAQESIPNEKRRSDDQPQVNTWRLLVTYLYWETAVEAHLGTIVRGPRDTGSLPDGHSVLYYASVLF